MPDLGAIFQNCMSYTCNIHGNQYFSVGTRHGLVLGFEACKGVSKTFSRCKSRDHSVLGRR